MMRRKMRLGLAVLLLGVAGSVSAELRFGLHEVRSFDVVAEGGRLHLLVAGPLESGGTAVLRYVLSPDGGHSFAAPVVVGAGQAPPFNPHRGSDVQLAVHAQRRLAVWTVAGSGYGGSGPLATAVSGDGGQRFTPGPNPADDGSDGGHAYAAIAADAQGIFHAVWLDSRAGAQGLHYAASGDGGQSWSANRTLDAGSCECCWNALLPADEIYVLYRDKAPRDMALMAGVEGRWQRRATVGAFNWTFDGCPHVGGALALSGRGESSRLHALVWTGASGKQGLWALRSADHGQRWRRPQRLGGERARHADLAAAGEQVAAVWDDRDAQGQRVIRLARSADQGRTWRDPQTLVTSASATHPRVVISGEQPLALWTQTGTDGRPVLMLVPAVE